VEQKSLLRAWETAVRRERGKVDKSERSRLLRVILKETFGGDIPSSVWPEDRSLDVEDPVGKGRNTVGYTEDRPTDMYGAQKTKRRMSIFEGRLAENCLQLWSDPGDLVLDPFAGRLCRLVKAAKLSRRYLGFDTDPAACKLNRAWARKNKADAEIICGSLLEYDLEPESVDCVFTCPPYWNSEFYGDNRAGLEGTPSYEAFLEELVAILALAADALKPDCYLVVVVKDFFLHRQMVSFHSDVIRGVTALGLVQWDCVVKHFGTLRKIFHRDIIQHRRTAQVHEYVLVFRKSPPKKGRDLYRVHCYESCKKRKEAEHDLRDLREQVLAEHGVDAGWLSPALQYGKVK
jgi:DNA modification methylase